jgi:hypothetical protein
MNTTSSRRDPFRGLVSLQDQVNRLFEDMVLQGRTGQADLATWAPAADIYETENDLVAKVTPQYCGQLTYSHMASKEMSIHATSSEVQKI